MAQPVQNINYSTFRSMFERKKLSENNFNDWFCQLTLVLKVEKKIFVIEQPLLVAPTADSAANELKSMFEKEAGVERFDLIQTFHACKQEEGFVRNYNIHNMGKTISELHAMLIKYEKGLPKNAETPQVMIIKGGKIQTFNKKSLKAKGKGKANGKGKDKQVYIPKPKPAAKEHLSKDDTCQHCKEVGHWKRNCLVYLAELLKKKKQVGSASSLDDELFDQCVSCLSGKMTRKSFSHRPERATDLLGIIHTDVCGPLRHVSRQGASYFITFTDDYNRYGYVYLLKHKHKVFETFKVFKNKVENQLRKTIKALRSDRGGEYISQEFQDYLKACGIVQQLTSPYTPQHNGVSERKNHTLLNMVRSMMNLTTLPLFFWDYALESATRILNMVPTKKVDKTPYELWYGKVPKLSYLKVWGCEALVKRDTLDKLQQRSVKCIFIGYPKETMGYYFYFPPKNKIVVARYAEFFEKNLITQEVSGRAIDLEEIQDEDTSPSEITSKIPMEVEGFELPQEEVIPICRSERAHRAPNRLCLNVEVEEHSLGDLNEPASYKTAMLDSESNKWIDAINAEIQSMIDNIVWVLVDLSPGCKTVGMYYDYKIWQMDVKIAFLNGYLDEDIYMVQPKGFIDPNHSRKEIEKFGFAQNLDEPFVYQKAGVSNVTFLILYVDDIIVMRNHIPSLQSVKDYLGKCFAMKDLGEATFILRIKIYRDRSKRLIRLGQNAYMDKILKRYKMDNSKSGHILMQERLDLNKTQGASTPNEVKRMQNVPYASAVSSIIYAVRCTRPDVAFAKNITSCFQQNPGECHWTVVKNILKYLRNTKDMLLVYGGNRKLNFELIAIAMLDLRPIEMIQNLRQDMSSF
nr:hypothetical protein [Tanacetum cinerariifolium]